MRKLSEEHKKKIGDFFRGRKQSAETIAKKSAYMKTQPSCFKGKTHSEEHKQNMRDRVGEKAGGWRGGKMTKNTRYHVLNRYGLTTEQYDGLLNKQNGVCAICKKPETFRKNLAIDHDHTCCPTHKSCGKCIRGLLCSRCNQALGLFKDDVLALESAIKYLQRTA
jgi:hypothetical protein